MKASFIVTINTDPEQSLASIAQTMEDKLSDSLDVVMVKPWARPRTNPNAQGQAVLGHFVNMMIQKPKQ